MDLTAEGLGPEWDFTNHIKDASVSRTFRRLYFPDYFTDGTDAFVDTSLNWWSATTLNGSSLPYSVLYFDSSSALHCRVVEAVLGLHTTCPGMVEKTWDLQNYNISGVATEIEEWEWHSSGVHDLMVVNIRYQSAEGPMLMLPGMLDSFLNLLNPIQ